MDMLQSYFNATDILTVVVYLFHNRCKGFVANYQTVSDLEIYRDLGDSRSFGKRALD